MKLILTVMVTMIIIIISISLLVIMIIMMKIITIMLIVMMLVLYKIMTLLQMIVKKLVMLQVRYHVSCQVQEQPLLSMIVILSVLTIITWYHVTMIVQPFQVWVLLKALPSRRISISRTTMIMWYTIYLLFRWICQVWKHPPQIIVILVLVVTLIMEMILILILFPIWFPYT